MHARTHPYPGIHTCKHAHAHTHTHTHKRMHPYAHTHVYTYRVTHTLSLTHTHTPSVDFSTAGFPLFGFLDRFTTPRTIMVSTIEDTLIEGPEEFVLRLTLQTSPGSSVGNFEVIRSLTTVIIIDDDDGGKG